MIDSYQKQQELKEARESDKRKKAKKALKNYSTGGNKGRAQKTIGEAKNLIKNATPWGMFSLFFQMKPFSDWMYGLALLAAILKDLLDFSEATGILYGLVIVLTFLTSIFIAMMMLLGSFENGAGRTQQKMIRSWLVLLGGTTVEMLFGINFLPIETLTVVIIYIMMLSARKQAKEDQKLVLSQTQESYA